jgi:subtilisin family serine protease
MDALTSGTLRCCCCCIGTHVAGTISAHNNGQGVMGTQPGTKLYILQVFNKLGSGSVSSIVAALNWLTTNGRRRHIRVVNMSLGGPSSRSVCTAMSQAVRQGMTFVVAAGERGKPKETLCLVCWGMLRHAKSLIPELLTACHWLLTGCQQRRAWCLLGVVCRATAHVSTVCAAGNAGLPMAATSPADCPMALAVTSMSDYNGQPGGGATPSYETDQDDTFTDFSNWGSSNQANRIVAGPGERLRQGCVSAGVCCTPEFRRAYNNCSAMDCV